MSFSLFGSKSIEGQFIHIESSRNINPYNIGINSMNIIESEEDLRIDKKDYFDSSMNIEEIIKKLKKVNN